MIDLAVFASGAGSNLSAILARLGDGSLTGARVSWVLSNRGSSGALQTARRANIPNTHISARTHPDRQDRIQAILENLEINSVRLIILAGYLRLVPEKVLDRFQGRILNIHPGPLPAYGGKGMYGRRVHEAVLANGERWTEVCIFEVDCEYDRGPVVARAAVPVLPGDGPEQLARRVRPVEHDLYWRVIQRYVDAG